jgi:DNA-binding transcriptional MerR regulator
MSAGYTIEHAAEITGVTAHTLRYYERIDLLRPVARAANGHRRYTDDDLGMVRFLCLLRSTGMPIREMTEFVELTRAGDHTIPRRIEVLHQHHDSLESRMKQDAAHLEALERKIRIYTDLLSDTRQSA